MTTHSEETDGAMAKDAAGDLVSKVHAVVQLNIKSDDSSRAYFVVKRPNGDQLKYGVPKVPLDVIFTTEGLVDLAQHGDVKPGKDVGLVISKEPFHVRAGRRLKGRRFH